MAARRLIAPVPVIAVNPEGSALITDVIALCGEVCRELDVDGLPDALKAIRRLKQRAAVQGHKRRPA